MLEGDLEVQREARQTAAVDRDEAQTAPEAEQQRRAQPEAELATTTQRLDGEEARDTAIAARAQDAPRAATPRRKR